MDQGEAARSFPGGKEQVCLPASVFKLWFCDRHISKWSLAPPASRNRFSTATFSTRTNQGLGKLNKFHKITVLDGAIGIICSFLLPEYIFSFLGHFQLGKSMYVIHCGQGKCGWERYRYIISVQNRKLPLWLPRLPLPIIGGNSDSDQGQFSVMLPNLQ